MLGNPWVEVPDRDGLWWLKRPDGTMEMALILPQEEGREPEFVRLLADDHRSEGEAKCLCRWHEYTPSGETHERRRYPVRRGQGCWSRVEEPPGLH